MRAFYLTDGMTASEPLFSSRPAGDRDHLLASPSVQDYVRTHLTLDSALLNVGRGVNSFDSLFEWVAMGDQRLEVNQAITNQANGFGVLVGVSELELEVDFVGTEMHERQ